MCAFQVQVYKLGRAKRFFFSLLRRRSQRCNELKVGLLLLSSFFFSRKEAEQVFLLVCVCLLSAVVVAVVFAAHWIVGVPAEGSLAAGPGAHVEPAARPVAVAVAVAASVAVMVVAYDQMV